ncbi:hypothetical protein [Acinetobacter sp. Ac_5812]|nr:hypothetical protein [Acinetobacter sp. Ac_5812]
MLYIQHTSGSRSFSRLTILAQYGLPTFYDMGVNLHRSNTF